MMTDEQYFSNKWLSRMWGCPGEIKAYEQQAADLLGAKIPAYDAEKIPGGSDPNPTESKNLEYTTLMFEIDKKRNNLSYENIRTFNIIQNLKEAKYRGILYDIYVNQKTIPQVADDFHYSVSTIKAYKLKALAEIYPFIPKGEVHE